MPRTAIQPPESCDLFNDKGEKIELKWRNIDVESRKSNKWIEDSDDRSASRRLHTSGIHRKQYALKKCTGDDTLLVRRNHQGRVNYWTTDQALTWNADAPVAEPTAAGSSKINDIPAFAVLARLSPRKNFAGQTGAKRKSPNNKQDQICQVCKLKFESTADIATDSPWMGCSFTTAADKKCSYWVHVHCKGFPDMTEKEAEKINFFCELHNPKKHGIRKPNVRTKKGKK
eukprot:TCONS_00041178-protein